MKAYSDNEDLALLSGIDPKRVVMITWIIAGILATIGGALYGWIKVLSHLLTLTICCLFLLQLLLEVLETLWSIFRWICNSFFRNIFDLCL